MLCDFPLPFLVFFSVDHRCLQRSATSASSATAPLRGVSINMIRLSRITYDYHLGPPFT
jgi:hypothetical protein